MKLSNRGPDDDLGKKNITIPGIGNGNLKVSFSVTNSYRTYYVEVSGLPGQTIPSLPLEVDEGNVCNRFSSHSHPLYIPDIGTGTIEIKKAFY